MTDCLYCGVELTHKDQKKFCCKKHYELYRAFATGKGMYNAMVKELHKQGRNRGRYVSPEITPEFLADVMYSQGGRCALTGVHLFTCSTGKGWEKLDRIHRPSIDRIDSDKDYTPSNIQLVSLVANLAKNRMSNNEMIKFVNLIRSQN